MVERARAVGAPSAVDRVPDHVANPAKYTRYALDEELTVGSGRVSNARGPSSATRDEHPNTPTIHVERESVDALPKPRFSLAAAANREDKKRAAPESSVATRAAVRVHLARRRPSMGEAMKTTTIGAPRAARARATCAVGKIKLARRLCSD